MPNSQKDIAVNIRYGHYEQTLSDLLLSILFRCFRICRRLSEFMFLLGPLYVLATYAYAYVTMRGNGADFTYPFSEVSAHPLV